MGLSAVLVLAVEMTLSLGVESLVCPSLYLGPRSMNCLEQRKGAWSRDELRRNFTS